MAHASLLQDLAVVMAVAAATTALCRFFRQPVVLGYLIAGFLIGPHTPPFAFVKDIHSIHTMAELGLVFLMFALGLEFSLPKLTRVGLRAALAGSVQILVMFAAGTELGAFLGWNRADRIFLGAMLSISSTTIIVKVLMDLKVEREDFAQVVFGILIIEDIAAILLLSLLPGLGAGEAAAGETTAAAFGTFFQISFFALFFLVAGLSLIPRLLEWVSRFRSREALGITALGLCLLGALSAEGAGFSVALGAFLAGAVIAASPESARVEAWFHPVRDMFSVLFFVSAGMLIDPNILWTHRWAVLAVSVATVAGKVIAVTGGALMAGYDLRSSLRMGLSMGQIGEFSFVIAGVGAAAGLTSDFLYPVAVGVSTVTTLLTPFLIKKADACVDAIDRVAPAPLLRGLAGYHDWFQRRFGVVKKSEGAVVSRYLVRLILYTVLFAAVVFTARALSLALTLWKDFPVAWQDPAQLVLWVAAAVAAMPVGTAMAKYADHFALLLFTQASPPWLLTRVNIRLLYNLFNGGLLALLSLFLGVVAARAFARMEVFAAALLAATASALLLRAAVARGREMLEKLLDEVVGLATSEPTRQAVLKAGSASLVLHDLTEEAAVLPGGAADGKTLMELRLRELSGASVVALYRQGRHLANPAPDTRLSAGDVVVLLGEPPQRRQAALLLAAGPSPAV